MIEQLKNYLRDESYDYENDTVSSILLDEDRIQIYFSVDEDYCVCVDNIQLYSQEGDYISLTLQDEDKLYNEVETLLNDWVKPSDNTVVIEGRSYNI